MVPDELDRALTELAGRERVLVGLDFDGVLAPIVADRDAARALPGSMAAVEALAALPLTWVVLVSGRALASLAAVSGIEPDGPLAPIGLVGSHGAETSLRPLSGARSGPVGMTDEEAHRLAAVTEALRDIARADAALDVEVKPTGAVLHTRQATPEIASTAEAEALAGPGSWPGVHAIRGKSVVELAVVETSKGIALQRLRSELGVDAVLYVGDDVTDETAFAVLGPGDVGVKVGTEPSRAAYRVDNPEDVRTLLQRLVADRSQR